MPDADRPVDPTLAALLRELRRPADLGPALDTRVMALVRAERWFRKPGFRRRIRVTCVAAAAILVVAVWIARDGPGGSVQFAIDAPSAGSITLVGDFNDWDPSGTPLQRGPAGRWVVDLALKPGRYRYGYLVNGHTWMADTRRPATPDPDFAEPTSLLTVQE